MTAWRDNPTRRGRRVRDAAPYKMKKAVKPPMSASSRGNTPKREYFDSDTIDGMSREEIAANLAAITRSMKSW